MPDTAPSALELLARNEEILQICYWYQGEGFGEVYTAPALRPFLDCEHPVIEAALEALTRQGRLERVGGTTPTGYRFTGVGKKEAARLFSDGFADFQGKGHGECAAGCCDGDDHSQCGDGCILS